MSALRIAFAGTPDFAVPALRALLQSHHEVIGVLTQPDRPKGRGQHVAASPVKQVAVEHGLPVSQPQTLKTEEGRAQLAGWNPEVLVVVAYGLILPPPALILPRLGCVNIHASLLPRWRGAAPIQRAVLAGDAESGITIMKMDVGLDTGPTFLRRSVPLTAQETGGSLHDRLAVAGADLIAVALDQLADDSAVLTPQPENDVTYAAKIGKAEAMIDWSWDAAKIDRQVRAFNPWPVAETRLEGEQLRIHRARLVKSDAARLQTLEAVPGQIVEVKGEDVLVACGRDYLAITEVQRPGRRPVGARDFANGVALPGRRLG